jgi:hypothetical protein
MSWKDDLPEEIRTNPALKDITDIEGLAKNHIDLQAHLGNSMKLPKDDWSPEEISAWDKKVLERAGGRLIPVPDVTDQQQGDDFFRPLGKPENPEGYTAPEDLDLSGINEEALKHFRNQVHNANLTDAQQKILLKHFTDDLKGMTQKSEQSVADTTNRLKVEWGQNIDLKRNELINKLTRVNAPPNLIEAVRTDKAGADVALFYDKILSQLGAEGHEIGGQVGGAGLETPAGLDAQISENELRLTALYSQEQTHAVKKQVSALVQKNVELRQKRDKLR